MANESVDLDSFLSITMEEMAKEVNLAMKTLKDGTLPDDSGDETLPDEGGDDNVS